MELVQAVTETLAEFIRDAGFAVLLSTARKSVNARSTGSTGHHCAGNWSGYGTARTHLSDQSEHIVKKFWS